MDKLIAQIAYDAYKTAAGGVSLATGDPLPSFDDLKDPIKDAWYAAALAVNDHLKAAVPTNPDIEVLCPHCGGRLEAGNFMGAPFAINRIPFVAISCSHCHKLLSVPTIPPKPSPVVVPQDFGGGSRRMPLGLVP